MTRAKDITDELRSIRLSKNIFQEDLACAAGYHRQQVLRWEGGRYRPYLDAVCDWAGALGYEIILQKKGEQ